MKFLHIRFFLKISANQGMPMKWEQVKRAKSGKDAFRTLAEQGSGGLSPFTKYSIIKMKSASLKLC